MVDELQQLFERAEQLPEDVQRRIAETLRLELDEEEAEEREPTAAERAAIAASDAEFAAGESLDFDDYVRKRHAREPQR